MTSYIKSPYFRHIPISVTLDLTIIYRCCKTVLIMHFLNVTDDASLTKYLECKRLYMC